MVLVKVRAQFYQQFDADHALDVPAEGFNGWQEEEIEIDTEHTALVVMHAWDAGTRDAFPGWYRHVEYLPRSQTILHGVFPRLLPAARAAGLHVLHVVGGGSYYKHLQGYKDAVRLAGKHRERHESIIKDATRKKLDQFKSMHAGCGMHNQHDIDQGFKMLDFPVEARPIDGEGIAENAEQLFASCKKLHVSHLIYVGFAINWCLLASPGGMIDMSRRGLLCSTIREATTAVENKETARGEIAKEVALWRVALAFGFVFKLADMLAGLSGVQATGKKKE